MTDYPRAVAVPPFVNSFMAYMCSGVALHLVQAGNVSPGGAAWGGANLAVFLPLVLPWHYVMRRMFWVNASSAGGNSDIGIFSPGGAAIWTNGGTACSGNSVPQYVSGPSGGLLLTPGAYLIGFSHSDTTANRIFLGTVTAAAGRYVGAVQQTSAYPLPSPATFATFAQTQWPLIGLTNTASGY